MLVWSPGEAGDEKVIACTAGTARSLTIEKLEAVHSDFVTRIETVEPGRRYLIHLKPVSSGKATVAVLKLVTDVGGVGQRIFSVFATVK